MADALPRRTTSGRREPTIEEFRESLELMADAMALPSEIPCPTCGDRPCTENCPNNIDKETA